MLKSSFIAAAAVVLLAVSGSVFAATGSQVGTFSGSLKVKGVHPVTGAKVTTKSVVLLSIAADNTTTLTIDGVDYVGQPDNFFGPVFANLVLQGPGPTIITAPIAFKGTSIKGLVQSFTFSAPFASSSGKMKLKNTSTTPPPGFAGFVAGADNITSSPEGPLPIADLSTLTSTITLAPIGFVADVNVGLNVTHTFTGDLDIFLHSPSGTIVELTTDNFGGSNANFLTLFDDEAALDILTGTNPYPFFHRPEGNLSDFDGEPVGGNWRLEITDDALLDVGTLNAWTLRIATTPLP